MKAPSSLADNPLSGFGIPAKTLGAVLGVVVLAHALVLQVAGDALAVGGKTAMRPFVTRAVAVSVAAAEPAPGLAPAAVTAASIPPAARLTKPARPRPRPLDTPNTQNTGTTLVATSPSAETTSADVSLEENQATALADQAQAAPEKVAPAQPEKPATATATPSSETVASAAAAPPGTPPAVAKPPVATVALTLPGSVRLLYKTVALVKGIHWNVNGELLWLQDGESYDARIEYSLFNLRKVLTSKGNIGSDGLRPLRYSDKFRSSEVAAHFERDKHKVVFSANTPDAPLLPGMQDEVSVFVQLGAMFAGAPGKYPAGTQLSFETIGARHPDTWVFEVQGEEKLSLPGGEVQTIKLVRAARREFDRTDELWLAPALGYLPVRIKLSERNGDFIDQQWRATETP